MMVVRAIRWSRCRICVFQKNNFERQLNVQVWSTCIFSCEPSLYAMSVNEVPKRMGIVPQMKPRLTWTARCAEGHNRDLSHTDRDTKSGRSLLSECCTRAISGVKRMWNQLSQIVEVVAMFCETRFPSSTAFFCRACVHNRVGSAGGATLVSRTSATHVHMNGVKWSAFSFSREASCSLERQQP